MAFLSRLVQEQMELMLYIDSNQNVEQIAIAKSVAAARAGAFNMMLNLPAAIKNVEEQLGKREEWKGKAARSTESGVLA